MGYGNFLFRCWSHCRDDTVKTIVTECKFCGGDILLYGVDDLLDTGHCKRCGSLCWLENNEWKWKFNESK